MLVQQSDSSMLRRLIIPDVFAEPTHPYVYATRRVEGVIGPVKKRASRVIAFLEGQTRTTDRKALNSRGVIRGWLSQSTSSLLVGLTEADPWPMDGYSEIIKLSAGKMLTRN